MTYKNKHKYINKPIKGDKLKANNINTRRQILKNIYIPKFLGISNILMGITKKSRYLIQNNVDSKFSDLYSLLYKKELLIQALGNIEKNKGRLTKGIDNTTIDGNSIKLIEELAEELKNGTFKFKPVLRVEVPKPKLLKPGEPNKMRPLGLPTFKDKIVQESIRIILESIYEPIFQKLNCNYGFRPYKNTHQAILYIKYNATGSNLAIEGDIKGAYDNVNHDKMIKILSKRISDTKFLNLLYQGFKAGMLQDGKLKDSILGVPQGGIASPILFNIYMHEFDEFIYNQMQEYIDQFNEKEKRSYKPRSKLYDKISTKFTRQKKKYYKLKASFGDKKFVELTQQQQSLLLEERKK